MTNIIVNIKNLIEEYIYGEYQKYLINNNILIIKSSDIKNIISEMYDENSKNIKQYIRNSLKDSMKNEYPSGTIENILLDIFQDRDINIINLTKIIDDYQMNNYFEIEKPIHNNQLGISVQIDDCFCKIGKVNDNTFPEKNIIEKYTYLYSINNIILNEQADIISCLKTIISQNTKVNIGIYKLISESELYEIINKLLRNIN